MNRPPKITGASAVPLVESSTNGSALRRFPDLPERMKSLPVDHRGFPVPWFVAWQEGKPIFPAMDPEKMARAIKYGNCWVCGERLGRFKTYVVGPMCLINRISSEPPSHIQCAEFAAKNCPFLANPRMGRVPIEKFGGCAENVAGTMLERNPGATALIECQGPIFWHRDGPGVLFDIKPISRVDWWALGRRATRAEVDASLESGLSILREMAEDEGLSAVKLLDRRIAEASEWLSKEIAA